MNYELAQNLRAAGWPQKTEDLLTTATYKGEVHTKPTEPTLSELIEACGEHFQEVRRLADGLFRACGTVEPYTVGSFEDVDEHTEVYSDEYDAPEDAVANLWLALNKK